jgi:putative multiple sugar transport system ATP-binding protein
MDNIYPKCEKKEPGDVALELKDWTVFDLSKDREILRHININVKKGEIVGLQGLMGAGRTELALSLFGNPTGYKITSGEFILKGEKVRFKHPKEAIKKGLAYVTEDRKGNGLILMQDIRYNITIANLEELVNGLAINENEEINVANGYKDSINIKAPSIEQKVGNLSGGNQQKVQLAKWMFAKPDVLILDEPTRGIDVGAKYEIYSLMNKLVEQGMSIIMISSELPEVLGMSDRLYVMSEGVIAGELSAEEATEEKVMAMAVRS